MLLLVHNVITHEFQFHTERRKRKEEEKKVERGRNRKEEKLARNDMRSFIQ